MNVYEIMKHKNEYVRLHVMTRGKTIFYYKGVIKKIIERLNLIIFDDVRMNECRFSCENIKNIDVL